MNIEQKTIEILSKKVLTVKTSTKKGGYFYQLYKVDFSKKIKIGGNNEIGYKLLFFNTSKLSNLVITNFSLLKAAQDEISINNEIYKFI